MLGLSLVKGFGGGLGDGDGRGQGLTLLDVINAVGSVEHTVTPISMTMTIKTGKI